MQRTGGFDARTRRGASGSLRYFHESLADAVAAMRFIDYQRRDPTPGAAVVQNWHQEVRRGSDERPADVGDEQSARGSASAPSRAPAKASSVCGWPSSSNKRAS
jgi:hypothetical protein